MNLATLSWLALAAYAFHILEEYTLDWRTCARSVLGLPVDWPVFYITNALVIVLGVVQAQLAPTWPIAPLAFAALMFINATFFHVLQTIRARGRFSPGLLTAVALFYPLAVAEFVEAHLEGRLTTPNVVGAFLIGAVLMAYPIVLLQLKRKAYFRQDEDPTPSVISIPQ